MNDSPAKLPLFTVIIATRNRAPLFEVALNSVLEQRFRDFEIVVVNDGSSEEHEARCRALVENAADKARMFSLVHVERGHGQSYSLNFGATQARGEYLCFLDDDDQWMDPDHLGRVGKAIAASPRQVEMVLSNQRAFRDGIAVERVAWIEGLERTLDRPPDASGAYDVTPAELLRCPAHCHLNTMVILRSFYLGLGGMDEGLRYECDVEFYLRAIDRAQAIRYLPNVVSRHNIPDPAAKSSMTTSESVLSKRLYQLRVLDKTVLFSSRPEIRRHAMRHRAYILKHLAMDAARAGQYDSAAYYAREALMTRFTIRWLGVVVLLAFQRRFGTALFRWPRPA